MKIPSGYTEAQILKIIEKICNRLASKYKFGIYDSDDIKQEAFIIALNALEDYSDSITIEAFLSVRIKSRLKDLFRDRFSRFSFACNNCSTFSAECNSCLKRKHTELTKRNILQPIDISTMDPTNESSILVSDISYENDLAEIVLLINKNLPVDMREDYLKIKDGAYVEKGRRNQIEAVIREIVKDYL